MDRSTPFFVENISQVDEILTIMRSNTTSEYQQFYNNFTVEYSLDGTTWGTLWVTSTTDFTMTLHPGDKIYLRANTPDWHIHAQWNSGEDPAGGTATGAWLGYKIKGISKVGGNIMSLMYGANFIGDEVDFPTHTSDIIGSVRRYGCRFYGIFGLNTNLINAEDLILPVTTLDEYCYGRMFEGCTALTATPELPATILAQNCYTYMFYDCTSLTGAPTLVATNLVNYCYQGMFKGCSSLTSIVCKAVYVSATGCFYNWVDGVAASGTFAKGKYVDIETGVSGIPSGWTVIDTPVNGLHFKYVKQWFLPGNREVGQVTDNQNRVIWRKPNNKAIPFYVENISNSNETLSIVKSDSNAPTISIYKSTNNSTWTILGNTSTTALTYTLTPGERLYLRANITNWGQGYQQAYNNISGMSKVGGNIMSLLYGDQFTGDEVSFRTNKAFAYLFYNATSLIDASELLFPALTAVQECYRALFQGCTNLIYAPTELDFTVGGVACCSGMFWDCTSLITAPKINMVTVNNQALEGMFHYCSNLETGPDLTAEVFANWSHTQLFNGCRRLNYIKCLATDISAPNCLKNWVANVAATGTFVKKAGVSWPTGDSGIPSGWTVIEV